MKRDREITDLFLSGRSMDSLSDDLDLSLRTIEAAIRRELIRRQKAKSAQGSGETPR